MTKRNTRTKSNVQNSDFDYNDFLRNRKTQVCDSLKNKGVKKHSIVGKNENQKKLLKIIKDSAISIGVGPAGTGKTYLALAEALSLVIDYKSPYSKIYITKPVAELIDEGLGFMPGDKEEKFSSYIESYTYLLNKLIGEDVTKWILSEKIIEIMPLAYIRGKNNENCVVIVDEAQNITLPNMRTLLTRIGENCKYIVLGDTEQIDLKKKSTSSLAVISTILVDIPEIDIVYFTDDDIVRNELIKKIEERFKEYLKNK